MALLATQPSRQPPSQSQSQSQSKSSLQLNLSTSMATSMPLSLFKGNSRKNESQELMKLLQDAQSLNRSLQGVSAASLDHGDTRDHADEMDNGLEFEETSFFEEEPQMQMQTQTQTRKRYQFKASPLNSSASKSIKSPKSIEMEPAMPLPTQHKPQFMRTLAEINDLSQTLVQRVSSMPEYEEDKRFGCCCVCVCMYACMHACIV